jgi:hypothetical protein
MEALDKATAMEEEEEVEDDDEEEESDEDEDAQVSWWIKVWVTSLYGSKCVFLACAGTGSPQAGCAGPSRQGTGSRGERTARLGRHHFSGGE